MFMCAARTMSVGDYQFLKGEGVELRQAFSTNAKSLTMHLVDGKVLDGLDTSNPDWL